MYINEYGHTNSPKIILLAPMLISGEELYRIVSPYLTGDYCIIAPDQGGHGKAGDYESADREYQALKSYLLERDYTHIKLLYGASLGVAVAYRLLLDPAFTVEKVWFDGVALHRNAALANFVMKHVFRIYKRKLARTHVEAAKTLVKLYGDDFAKLMTGNIARLTDDDIANICHACSHYDLQALTDEQQAKLHLEYGEKDGDLRLSKKALKKYLPQVTPVIRAGYAHCGYMAAQPQAYVEELERFIKG